MSTTKPYIIIILLAALGLTACKNGTQKEEPQKVDSDSVTVVKSDNPIYDRLLASRWDRYLGMTAPMTQVPVPTAIFENYNKAKQKFGENLARITGSVLLITYQGKQ